MTESSMFKKAVREQSKLRLALIGPPGSGKTYSALALATHLVPGGSIAVIDTERGSASKYARTPRSPHLFEFDVCELTRFAPSDYIKTIQGASAYDVLVIDSLSPAWSGKGGALEMVDAETTRSRAQNSFASWRKVTPHHNALIDAILAFPGHVIATVRSKVEWAQEKDEKGKTVIRKVGMAPIQRDGLEYEFDLVGDMDQEHRLAVSKSRCPDLADAVIEKPGEDMAIVLREWLTDGAQAAPRAAAPQPAPPAPAHAAAADAPAPAESTPQEAMGKSLAEGERMADVLAAIKAARSREDLAQVTAAAAALPPSCRSVARAAYGQRLERLGKEQPVAFALEGPQRAALVDMLGQMGYDLESQGLADVGDDDLQTLVDWLKLQ